jgi:hypothetical protein
MSSYKFNFKDLSRFTDDLMYLLQKGGRDKQIFDKLKDKSFAEKIIKWVVIIFKLILIVVALYVLYILIFRGYPRAFINLATFKFSNKQNLDAFISERNLLINSIKFFVDKHKSCIPPYAIYQMLYGPTNIMASINKFEQLKDKYHAKEKYDDKYHSAFKNYFLFFNKVNKPVTKEVWYKTTQMKIDYYDFYEILATYRISKGEMSEHNPNTGGRKGDDEIMQEIYTFEKKLNFITREGIMNINQTLKDLAKECTSIVNTLNQTPIMPFIIVPEDEKVMTKIVGDVMKFKTAIDNGSIYNVPHEQISDHAWTFIEYLMSLKDSNQYSTFASSMPAYTNQDMNKLIYYINLPREQKLIAEKRVMNYSQNREFFEYIKKRPVFTHMYFSKSISNKDPLYQQVMNGYKLLCECDTNSFSPEISATNIKKKIENLQKNGYVFKRFILSTLYIHQFLNVYQTSITQMYEKQIISNKRFFQELWVPFFEDFVINRMGNHFKRTFGSQGMGKSYKNFEKWWKWLGKELNRLIKGVFKAFFTSAPVEKPKETQTDDGQSNS